MSVQQKAAQLLISREKNLKTRSVSSIAASLGSLSSKWLDKKFVYRRKAVQALARRSGFSILMAEDLLEALFSELTAAKIVMLLKSELGDARALDGFIKTPSGTLTRAEGPRLMTHIFSANLPNPAITSLVYGMLVKSANVAKVSRRDPGIVEIYLDSLKRHDRRLFQTNHLTDAEDRNSVAAWVALSDAVTVYGGSETVNTFWKMAGPSKIFTGYGRRVSFSLYTRETMSRGQAGELAEKTARDIRMADQRGCLSPSVIYLEDGAEVSPRVFSALIASSLERLASMDGVLPDSRRTADKRRLAQEWKLKKIAGENAFYLESAVPGRWALFFDEAGPGFPLSCGAQTIFVRRFSRFERIKSHLSPLAGFLQAAAVEAPPNRRKKIAEALSVLGVNRVTRAGKLQHPPVAWHHDGRPNFASWLRWTDLE